MQKQFKVGQVWQCSNGDVERITEIADESATACPIVCASRMTYTPDGKALTDGEKHPCDLAQLIHDPDAPPKFNRDQMAWERYNAKDLRAHEAYSDVDGFIAEMAKQHEAKQ